MAKNGVVIHYDILEQLKDFTNEEFGIIMRAIIKYDKDSVYPKFNDNKIEFAFNFLKPMIDRNKEKYENKCKQNTENIKKRWQQVNTNSTNHTNEYDCIRTNTIDTNYTDNDNDNDIDNVCIISKKESNNINNKEEDMRACVRESYDSIFEDFGVGKQLKDKFIEFIRHCQLNGKMVTNDKLKDIIIRLDMAYDDDVPKIQSLKKAINGGYFDIAEK